MLKNSRAYPLLTVQFWHIWQLSELPAAGMLFTGFLFGSTGGPVHRSLFWSSWAGGALGFCKNWCTAFVFSVCNNDGYQSHCDIWKKNGCQIQLFHVLLSELHQQLLKNINNLLCELLVVFPLYNAQQNNNINQYLQSFRSCHVVALPNQAAGYVYLSVCDKDALSAPTTCCVCVFWCSCDVQNNYLRVW